MCFVGGVYARARALARSQPAAGLLVEVLKQAEVLYPQRQPKYHSHCKQLLLRIRVSRCTFVMLIKVDKASLCPA
jgi:hypothetical protein